MNTPNPSPSLAAAELVADTTPAEDATSPHDGDRHKLLNWANITYRYHRKRQWFFEKCDMVTQVASVAMGLAIFGKPLQDYLPWLGLFIAILAFFLWVVRYAERAQCHKQLAEDARALIGEIEALPFKEIKDKTRQPVERQMHRH
ncbi:hypothetical protein G7047_00005 [Diaphorobacter sp. HDW4A]|uniref:hypothetical protein n=1 Tax=Diaphorobacter sp. HDW4A TaxID=2714924 RepID=UPI0014082577|nr:hypothetical protein [Diaphorobacter sp. HDW4A]QIL83601.1 hypothetical protein G7047_00005 [Diaphorobacter sp. HDW4A]